MPQSANLKSAASSTKVFEPSPEGRWAWEALTQDMGGSVVVVNGSGAIEYASAGAGMVLKGCGDGRCVGRHLSEFLAAGVLTERMSAVKQALETQETVHLEGFINGSLMRCAYRRIPGERVLWTSRALQPSDPLRHKPMAGVQPTRSNDLGALGVLTGRELEILKLIGLGLSSAAIAERLERSVKTIEWHRVSLGEKLAVANRVELARIAIGSGLVAPAVAGTERVGRGAARKGHGIE